MKKRLGAMLLASCLLCTNVVTTRAETLLIDGKKIEYNLSAISLYVNNELVETKTMNPIQLEGRVLVPAREVFEAMGANVLWDNTLKKVTIKYKDKTIILTMNQTEAIINDTVVSMDVPGKIINNKVMIPIRFVSEAMGLNVRWDSSNRAVWITEPVSDTPSESITGQTFKGETNSNSLSIPSGSYDTTTINSVGVSENNNELLATITSASAMSNVNVSTMTGKVIVDIKNSQSKLSNQIIPATNTYVKSIRTSQFTSDTTRIVFDLKSGAQIKASISDDRTKVYIKLVSQNLEEVTISSSNKKDTVYFKGLGAAQISLSEAQKDKKIQFTLANTHIEKNINWTGMKSQFISKITMSQVGNDVKGIIELTAAASCSLEDTTNGMHLVLTATTSSDNQPDEEKPSTDEPDDNQSEQVTSGLIYTSGSQPKLTLGGVKGSIASQIKVTDDYRNKKITFDLGADYSAVIKTETRTINDAYIQTISVSNSGTTKITVETKTVYAYNIIQSNGNVVLELVRPKEKYNQIVVLDLGHGGSDSGAVANGLKEKEVNFNQGIALYKLLEADPNIKVYMTRESDVYPTLQFRSALANEIDADLFVSIHNNSASASISGTETLYFPSTTDTRGKAIAQLVQNAIVNNCGMINRGIKA
ncbi:MAG: N-acetylmuramoyl-L-alanine amidase family protein, partial [Candidatus Cellulosilyticum pullistercoris]|nr:N-acetylmuramoyl-L-alanine amidase family protein [Candidatus Cellulosilyticum pullistercoris]